LKEPCVEKIAEMQIAIAKQRCAGKSDGHYFSRRQGQGGPADRAEAKGFNRCARARGTRDGEQICDTAQQQGFKGKIRRTQQRAQKIDIPQQPDQAIISSRARTRKQTACPSTTLPRISCGSWWRWRTSCAFLYGKAHTRARPSAAWQEIRVRSGRDDNSVARKWPRLRFRFNNLDGTTELSSRPKRSVVDLRFASSGVSDDKDAYCTSNGTSPRVM
jgi:hypothetical protein